MAVKQLPIIKIGDTSYFVDERLKEFRNINNPHDRLTLVEAVAKGLGVDAGFCEICGCVIPLNIERFKELHCSKCALFLTQHCKGASDKITMCVSCCAEDLAVDLSNADSGADVGLPVSTLALKAEAGDN